MAVEDDNLAIYEANKLKAADRDRLALQRNELLSKQSSHQWEELRRKITESCKFYNNKAGREIFQSLSPKTNELDIRREDGAKFTASYAPNVTIVTFSSDVFPPVEEKYELTVRPINGVDTVVWKTLDGKTITESGKIAETLVGNFLRAEFSL